MTSTLNQAGPRAETSVRAPSGRPSSSIAFVPRATILALVPVVVAILLGLPYYTAPISERLWHPLHPWFKPSGYVGQTAGFAALLSFLFLWLYPIRKRFASGLSFTGSLRAWLDAHVVAGLLSPILAAMHAAFRFDGLIGLGYASMAVVAVSGVVGRYLYLHIPRARSGLAITREDAASQRRQLVGEIVAATGISSEGVLRLLAPSPAPGGKQGLLPTVGRMVADDLARRRAVSQLRREWKRSGREPDRNALREVTRLARREMAIAQQIRLLSGTNAVFRFWHAAHRPFAVTAFLAIAIHVAVVIVVGATWIR